MQARKNWQAKAQRRYCEEAQAFSAQTYQ